MIYDKKSYSFIVKSIINNNCIIERFYRLLSSLSELYDCQSAGGGQHEDEMISSSKKEMKQGDAFSHEIYYYIDFRFRKCYYPVLKDTCC